MSWNSMSGAGESDRPSDRAPGRREPPRRRRARGAPPRRRPRHGLLPPRLVEFLVQRLERARGFLAAGHAEIEPLFLPQENRVCIVLTIVSALSAILLAHGRHHATPQRPG